MGRQTAGWQAGNVSPVKRDKGMTLRPLVLTVVIGSHRGLVFEEPAGTDDEDIPTCKLLVIQHM